MKKKGPISYIIAGIVMAYCSLIIIDSDAPIIFQDAKSVINLYLFFFFFGLLGSLFGIITLIKEGIRWKIIIGVFGIVMQASIYFWSWQLYKNILKDLY